MSPSLSRRGFFSNAAKHAAGVSAGFVGLGILAANRSLAQSQNPPWPWPYAKLDPDYVRILGHDSYYVNGCGYAGFYAIIQALAEKVGAPFNSIPPELMTFGYGGVIGWGTLCGALNGASAAMSLVTDKTTMAKIVNELVGWYTQTKFPSDKSNEFAQKHTFKDNRYDGVLSQNVSGSPLCHQSVTGWCLQAGFAEASAERKERCARLSGDVAAHAVELLNQTVDNAFVATYVAPKTIGACMTCHGTGSLDNVAAKSECTQCHDDPHKATLTGDVNNDGRVDFNDFLILAQNFNKSL
jgi:hypothetical protein